MVDAAGKPIPWFTYPAIDYIRQLDLSEKTIFEWGAGFSTLFWSSRAKSVISVETDPLWYSFLSRSSPRTVSSFWLPVKWIIFFSHPKQKRIRCNCHRWNRRKQSIL